MTEVGLELARTARAVAAEWEGFEQRLDARKGYLRGTLRVAVVCTAKYFVPRLLGTFCKRYPEIDVSFEVLNRDGVVSRLRNNLDDIYVMSTPPADIDLVGEIFMANPLVMICATKNPLAKRTSLALSDLSAQRFILRERAQAHAWRLTTTLRAPNFAPTCGWSLVATRPLRNRWRGAWACLSSLATHCMGMRASTGCAC